MKIICCSSVYRIQTYGELSKKSKIPLSLADHNLNRSMITGLDEVMGVPAILVNNEPLPSFPNYPQLLFKTKLWKHTQGAHDWNCGYINLPGVKYLTRAEAVYHLLKKIVKGSQDKKIVIFTYDLHWDLCTAIARIKKKFPFVHISAALPDIPAVMADVNHGNPMKIKINAKMKMAHIQMFDSYVLLTKYMTDYVNVEEKSYVVVEGIYRKQESPGCIYEDSKKKAVFYSGQLNSRYGIKNLVQAVVRLHQKRPEYELWVCGGGELEGYINKQADIYPFIKYYGYLNTPRIRELQAKATVLINPRQNTGNYTRYSFPSKTMEYLASGKPVIGYKLDGIPDEYDPFIKYVEHGTIEALEKKIQEICGLPLCEREAMGAKSREFILNCKNPEKMCGKIIDMWRGCL